MIHTSTQLKALVRNLSKGNSAKAQTIIRNYIMERFLERLSLSPYKGNLILKGGMLISSMVGLDTRSTMDMDATMKGFPLTEESASRIVTKIASIHIDDGIIFETQKVEPIMEEGDYPGIRITLSASLEKMETPLKIDFSAGDVITPGEAEYSYDLMFENRAISILAYPMETVLAEKLETILSRGTANTRMRDFYDIYVLTATKSDAINLATLQDALVNTCQARGSSDNLADASKILEEIRTNPELMKLWKQYQKKFDFAADVEWQNAIEAIDNIIRMLAG